MSAKISWSTNLTKPEAQAHSMQRRTDHNKTKNGDHLFAVIWVLQSLFNKFIMRKIEDRENKRQIWKEINENKHNNCS